MNRPIYPNRTRRVSPVLAVVGIWGLICAGTAGLSGCANKSSARPSAELEGDQPGAAGTLDDREIPAVIAAMESVFDEQQFEVQQPTTAAKRGRWSDVIDAVTVAFDEPGVVAIVLRSTLIDDRKWVIDFTLTDDRRGQLVIERTFDASVYRSSVTLGRLDLDDPIKQRMLNAVDRQMKAFGSKRSFRDSP